MAAKWSQQAEDLVLHSKQQQAASMQQQAISMQQQQQQFSLSAQDTACLLSPLQDNTVCRPGEDPSFSQIEKNAAASLPAWGVRHVDEQQLPCPRPVGSSSSTAAADFFLGRPEALQQLSLPPVNPTQALPSASCILLQRFAVLCLLEAAVRQRLEQFKQLQQRMQQQRLLCADQQRDMQHRRGGGRHNLHGDSTGETNVYNTSLQQSHSSSKGGGGSSRRGQTQQRRWRRGRGRDEWGEAAVAGEDSAEGGEGGSSESEDSAGELAAAARGSLSLLLNKHGQALPSNADAISIWHHRNRLQPVGRSASKAKLRAAAAAAAEAAAAAAVAAASASCASSSTERDGSGVSRAGTPARRQLQQVSAAGVAEEKTAAAAAGASSDWGEALLRWQLQEARVKRRRRAGSQRMTQIPHTEERSEKDVFPPATAAAGDAAVTRAEGGPGAHMRRVTAAAAGLPHAEEGAQEEAARRRSAAAIETRIVRSFLWELRAALLAIPVPVGAVHALFHHCRPHRPQQPTAPPAASEEAVEAALLSVVPGDIHPSRLLHATRNLLLACRRLRRQPTQRQQQRTQQQQETPAPQEPQVERPRQQVEQQQVLQHMQSSEAQRETAEQRENGAPQEGEGGTCGRGEAGRRRVHACRSGSDRQLEPVVSPVPTLRSLLRDVCTAVSASMPPVLAALTPAECLIRFINSGSVSRAVNRRLQTALAVSSTVSAAAGASPAAAAGAVSARAVSAGAAAPAAHKHSLRRASDGGWPRRGVSATAAAEERETEDEASAEATAGSSSRVCGRLWGDEDAAKAAAVDNASRMQRAVGKQSCCRVFPRSARDSPAACAPGGGGVCSAAATASNGAAAAAGGASADLSAVADGAPAAVCTAADAAAECPAAVSLSAWAEKKRQWQTSRSEGFHLLVSVERAILQGLRLYLKAQQQQQTPRQQRGGGSAWQRACQEEEEQQQQLRIDEHGPPSRSNRAWGQTEAVLLLGESQEIVEKEVCEALLRNRCTNIIYFSSLLQQECLPPFCVFQVLLHLRREAEKQQQQQQQCYPTKWEGEEEEGEELQQQQQQERHPRKGGEKGLQQQQDGLTDKQRQLQEEPQQLARKQQEQPAAPQQQQQSHQRPVLVLQHRRSWTAEEDERLLQAVRYVGVQQKGAGKWMRVAGLLPGRSNNQCRARYLYLVVEEKRHGLFSPLEDVRLQLLVTCYGRGSWGRIARHLRGRTEMKCRERYEHCIYEDVKSLPWTASEDALLRAAAPFFRYSWQEVQRVLGGRTAEQCRERFEALQSEEKAQRQVLLFLSSCLTHSDSFQNGGLSSLPTSNSQEIFAWAQQHLLRLFHVFAPYRCFSATVDAAVQAAAAAAPSAAVRAAVSPPAAVARPFVGLVPHRSKEEGSSVALSMAEFARYVRSLQLVAVAVHSRSAAALSSPALHAPIADASAVSSEAAAKPAEQVFTVLRDKPPTARLEVSDLLQRLLVSCDYLVSSVEKAVVASFASYRLLSAKFEQQLSEQMQEMAFRTAHPGFFFGIVGESLGDTTSIEAQLTARRPQALLPRSAEKECEQLPRRACEQATLDSTASPDAVVLPDFRLSPYVTPVFLAPIFERLRLRMASWCENRSHASGDSAVGSQISSEKAKHSDDICLGGASVIQEVSAAQERSLRALRKGMRMPLRYLQQRALPPSLIEAASKVAAAEIRAWRLNASAQKREYNVGKQQQERPCVAPEPVDAAEDSQSSRESVTEGMSTTDPSVVPQQQQDSLITLAGAAAQDQSSLVYVDALSHTQAQRRTGRAKPTQKVTREVEKTLSGDADARGPAALSRESQRGRRRRSRASVALVRSAKAAVNTAEKPAWQGVRGETAEESPPADAVPGGASGTLSRRQESIIVDREGQGGCSSSARGARKADLGLDTREKEGNQRGKRRRLNQNRRNADAGVPSRQRVEAHRHSRRSTAQGETHTGASEEWEGTASCASVVDQEGTDTETQSRPARKTAVRLPGEVEVDTGTEPKASDNAKQGTVTAETEGEQGITAAERPYRTSVTGGRRATMFSVEDRERDEVVVREQDAATQASLRYSTLRCRTTLRQEASAHDEEGELRKSSCDSTGEVGDVTGGGTKQVSPVNVRDSNARGRVEDDSVDELCQCQELRTDRSSENSTTRDVVHCVVDYHRNLPEAEWVVEEGLPVAHAGTALNHLLGQTVLGIPVLERGKRILEGGEAWCLVKRALRKGKACRPVSAGDSEQ